MHHPWWLSQALLAIDNTDFGTLFIFSMHCFTVSKCRGQGDSKKFLGSDLADFWDIASLGQWKSGATLFQCGQVGPYF